MPNRSLTQHVSVLQQPVQRNFERFTEDKRYFAARKAWKVLISFLSRKWAFSPLQQSGFVKKWDGCLKHRNPLSPFIRCDYMTSLAWIRVHVAERNKTFCWNMTFILGLLNQEGSSHLEFKGYKRRVHSTFDASQKYILSKVSTCMFCFMWASWEINLTLWKSVLNVGYFVNWFDQLSRTYRWWSFPTIRKLSNCLVITEILRHWEIQTIPNLREH